MRTECAEAVVKALGRDLTKAELDSIEERITRAMRNTARQDPVAWQAKPQAERLQEAAKVAAAEVVGEQVLKQRRAALTITTRAAIQHYLTDQKARGIDGLESLDRLIAFHADLKSNTVSLEKSAQSIEHRALSQMLGTLEASDPKWFGLYENHQGITAIVKEIFGEASGNPEAKAGAKLWHEQTGALRERFNRAGGDVGQLEDWGLPHHHSQSKVAKAGRDQWVADTLPETDRAHYFNPDGTRMSDAQIGDFLKEAWPTIATGGANKLEPATFKGSGARANRGSESRQIHFKDADAYMRYQAKYGDKSLYEVLMSHIASISKDIALTESLGPNPDHTFRLFRDEAVREQKLADPTQVGKIDQRAIRTENLYNVVSGKTQPVASQWLAKTFDTLKNWLIAARLGSSVITSFSDDATLYLTSKLNHLPEMRLLANELAAFNPANRMEERLAMRAGLALNTLKSSLNRFGQNGLGSSFSSKLANSVLRVSGLNAMTEARKRSFGATMYSALGSVTHEHASLADLDKTDHRVLLSKGITDTDFQVWKKAQLEDWGGGNDTMLTPESIYRIPDQALASLGDPRALREQAATKLLAHVLEETDVAVIEPGAVERAFTGAGLQRGTWKGELTRSFFLFKSFPLAMITRHWARGMSLPNVGGRAAYLATLFAATTVLGVASLQVNEILAGRDPKNLNPAAKGGVRNWIQAMLKGGSLGIYGDFLFSDSTQYGNSPIATITGPVLGLAEDAFNLTQGNVVKSLQDKKTNMGAEAVRFVKGNTPGASLWYAKAALDHLFFQQLQEYFTPGYLARMRARAQTDFNQRYYWEPGTASPQRAPDMGATLQ